MPSEIPGRLHPSFCAFFAPFTLKSPFYATGIPLRNPHFPAIFPLRPPNSTLTMKPHYFLLPAVLLFTFNLSAKEEPTEKATQEYAEDTVILTVDDTPITVHDVREVFTGRYGRQFERMQPAERKLVEPQVQQLIITDLISRILLVNAATEAGFDVTEEEITANLDKLQEFAKKQELLSDDASFEDFVAESGVSVERLRAQIADEMKIQKLLDQELSAIPEPTEEDLRKIYDENPEKFKQDQSVEASHILISTHDSEEAEDLKKKKALAEKIYKQLEESDGEDFQDLVQEHSDCPSKAQGGSLGEVPKGKMPPEFETVAFSQKTGTIGAPIKTQFGYHIIRTDAKHDPRNLKFEEVKDVIAVWLKDQEKEKHRSAYLKKLQNDAKIVRMVEKPAAEEQSQ